MARKTQAVRDLVQEVLAVQPEPFGQDIIEEVLTAIERNPQWSLRYRAISHELTQGTVNQWIGRYTKELTGKQAGEQATSRTSLASTYTRLK